MSALAAALAAHAEQAPSRVALREPGPRGPDGRRAYRVTTTRELDDEVSRVARGLLASGLSPGDRVALMIKPSRALFATVYGLFRAGLVPVLVDPGLGLKNVARCLDETSPRGFVGIRAAHAARALFGWGRGTVAVSVCADGSFPFTTPMREVLARGAAGALPTPGDDDAAAIVFTSGSTGAPKGVLYTHGNFAAQLAMIRDAFALRPGEVNVPTFAPFALFDPALGLSTVLPVMDFTRPARVDPREIIEPVRRFSATMLFGSPALLDRVASWEGAPFTRLPSLRRVLSAGAPVPPSVLEAWAPMLSPDAEIFTPYGATEALPVAIIGSRAVLGETAAETKRGAGTCVGRPVPGVEVVIAPISDAPIASRADIAPRGVDEIGEICVKGANVTREYVGRPEANAQAKVSDPAGGFFHRMGDLGRVDAAGRLWFAGRKSHRVETARGPLFTDPVEGVFNQHPDVRRTALVGVRGAPVVCVELHAATARPRAELIAELSALGAAHGVTREVTVFLFHPAFPVDIRHNAKIFREQLAVWAAAELSRR
ncbi:MAG: AMP-binding protein [Polyangiaceae bacterium]|nr:AMP-binding protein [Polyangiaceae bacterium]